MFPACHTSHVGHSPPMYGTLALKNCHCFRQLARHACRHPGGNGTAGAGSRAGAECLYPALRGRGSLCFVQRGVELRAQSSDLPPGGLASDRLDWFQGWGEDAPPAPAPANHTVQGYYQVPLAACKDRCSDRGVCVSSEPAPGPWPAAGTAAFCLCAVGYEGEACGAAVQSHCYVRCEGGAAGAAPAGRCHQGFCHCPPGRWGLGCTRDEAWDSSAGWLPSLASMRIFVYDPPTALVHRVTNDHFESIDTNYIAEREFTEELLADAAAGAAGWGVVTQNPWEANLFLVPTWSLHYSGNVDPPAALLSRVAAWLQAPSRQLPGGHSFWREAGGRNHVLWATNDLGGCRRARQWAPQEAWMRSAILMVHFGNAPPAPPLHPLAWGTPAAGAVLAEAREAATEAEREPLFKGFPLYGREDTEAEWEPCYSPEKDVVAMPYLPPHLAAYSAAVFGPNHSLPLPRGERPLTLFLAATNRAGAAHYSHGVRQAIFALAEGEDWKRPDYLIGPAGDEESLASARFCLAPLGSGWGIRLLDAVALGCVPVIVQDHVYQYLWDALPYSEFSLRVPRRLLPRLPALLDAVSPRQLAALQRGLATWHTAFLYRSHSSAGAAFNHTLRALRHRLDGLQAALWRR